MGATRRRFTLEHRIEAAHRLIDSDRSVAEVARDLSLAETTLAKWVRDERRRMTAAAGAHEAPLSAAERAEQVRLPPQGHYAARVHYKKVAGFQKRNSPFDRMLNL